MKKAPAQKAAPKAEAAPGKSILILSIRRRRTSFRKRQRKRKRWKRPRR